MAIRVITAPEFKTEVERGRTEAFKTKRRTREEAIEAARRLAAETELGVGAVEEATEAGRAGLRMRAAQALAATQGLEAPAGGARAAMARGTAMEEGIRGAEFEAAQAGREVEARQAAAAMQLEAAKFEQEVGTEAEDRQEKMADYQAQINSIINRHDAWYDIDEAAIRDDILALAEFETDPVLRDYLKREAQRLFLNVDKG